MEDTFVDYSVVCRTPGCGNADIAITIQALAENPQVICGVCAQSITDITPVTK